MRIPALGLLGALFLALPACGKGSGEQKARAEGSAPSERRLEKKKFGGEITEKTSTPLDALVKDPNRYLSQTVRTEGRVSAVCEHMGCWMEITDEAGTAHVKMAGHGFFIPREASGRRAVVQGKVLEGEKEEKVTCTDDSGKPPGPVAKIELEASAFEIVD